MSMYLAVDIGGTKVLMATFTNEGKLVNSIKLPTPESYESFLELFKQNLPQLGDHDYNSCGVAIPGIVDRENGVGIRFGNLAWSNVPIKDDLESITKCPVVLENDAKAGAIYQAYNLKDEFNKVLYIAVGTGIGIAYVNNGVLDTSFGDRGGNRIILNHNGSEVTWESFASGKAIAERFGKKASEISDPKIWKILAHDFAMGLVELIALIDTEVIVFGGGVGAHFSKYSRFLKEELKKYEVPIQPTPKLKMAINPEEAVIYGCYQLAKSIR